MGKLYLLDYEAAINLIFQSLTLFTEHINILYDLVQTLMKTLRGAYVTYLYKSVFCASPFYAIIIPGRPIIKMVT